jgi:hypothetical protein
MLRLLAEVFQSFPKTLPQMPMLTGAANLATDGKIPPN